MDPRPHSATPVAPQPRHAADCACDPCFAARVKRAQRAVARLVAIGAADGLRVASEQRAESHRLPLPADLTYAQAVDLVRAYTAEGGDPGPSDSLAADLGALALLASDGRATARDSRREADFGAACVAHPARTGRTDLPVRSERPGEPRPTVVSGGVPGFWSKAEARWVRRSVDALRTAYRLAGHDRHAEGGDCDPDCAGCLTVLLQTARERASDFSLPQRIRRNYARVAHSLARQIAASRASDAYAQGPGE